MKHLLFLLVFIVAFTSCKNKSLELPQVPISGISEIQNHSQLWVFYEKDNDNIKADLNRKNTIGSTHWIINIDKKLPLSEIIPIFQMIKNKREDKGLHSVEGAKNFLSYSDVLHEKIALFPFDGIQYMMQSSEEMAKMEQEIPCKYILAFSEEAIWLNEHKFSLKAWDAFSLDSLTPGRIQLQFDTQLTYQEYMYYRLSVGEMLPKDVILESTEYVIQ